MTMINTTATTTTSAPYTFGEQLVGGRWYPGRGRTVNTVVDPYTSATLLEIPEADVSDVEAAFLAAETAQPAWERTTPTERATVLRRAVDILERRQEECVRWLIQESGSTRLKATMEWGAVHAILTHAATLAHLAEGRIIPGDIAGKENRMYRKPVGVVSVISPWNWPAHLTSRALGPALALGNSVVVKPADETPVTGGLFFGRLFEEAGLPPGVLNVVSGPAGRIGDAFVLNPHSRVISFTGSTAVGRRIAGHAATGPVMKSVMLELGGNNPMVVLDDADLGLATTAAVSGKFLHQGQICVIANRLIVHQNVHDAFMDLYVEKVRALKVGDPNDPATAIGPLISGRQLDRVERLITGAKQAGARQVLGGTPDGLVLPPHVFTDVTPDMDLSVSEIFGPVAPVIKAADEAAALRLANDTEYGLSSAVFSSDAERALAFAHRLEAGMTHINDSPLVDLVNMPFGGEKNSGVGRYGTQALIDELTREHWISVQHTPRVYPF